MKKAALNEKLMHYSAMAGCLLAGAKFADAQVVYTDINPDFVTSNSEYALDLNNDGIVDFRITTYAYISSSSDYASVYISAEGDNAIAQLQEYPQEYKYPGVFNSGDRIDGALSWLGGPGSQTLAYFSFSAYSGYVYTSGNWLGQDKKYLALQFTVNDERHYGWVRLSVDKYAAPCAIYDYAYEASPNTMITAGDIGKVTFYADEDGDGYGDVKDAGHTFYANPGEHYSTVNNDCNDSNHGVHAGANEVAKNGIDDDCNGYTDELFTGIMDDVSPFMFHIISNSASKNVSLEIQLPKDGLIRMSVFDLSGHELYSENWNGSAGIISKQVPCNNFSAGTYLLQVSSNAKSEVKKFVVEN